MNNVHVHMYLFSIQLQIIRYREMSGVICQHGASNEYLKHIFFMAI